MGTNEPLFTLEIDAMLERLTDRQRAFVLSYVVHLNATKAAHEAGYSDGSLRQMGSENLSKPDISSVIDAILTRQAMGIPEAMRRMTDWGRGTIEPLLSINEAGDVLVDLSTATAQAHLHLIKKIKQRKTIRHDQNGRTEEVHIEIEIHDAKDATTRLLEAHGKIKPSGELSVAVQITPEDARAFREAFDQKY